MVRKKRRARNPRSRWGDGSGWTWFLIRSRHPRAKTSGSGKAFSLAGAVSRLVTLFGTIRFTEKKRGRRPLARVHPHRYRARGRSNKF